MSFHRLLLPRRYNMLLAILGVLFGSATTQDLSFTTDIRTLSELPLERLLQIKQTFYVDEEGVDEFKGNSSEGDTPQALALQSKKKPKDREGAYHTYHYVDDHPHPHPQKSSKTDVQSIFQISVTTLAFLAFGGYLICLLVQAVKGKNNYDNMSTATQIMSALVNSQVRRRATRAPQRLQNQRPGNGYRKKRRPRPRPRPRPKREFMVAEEGEVTEIMYRALIDLSEGYTKYHTEDYLKYNSSGFF